MNNWDNSIVVGGGCFIELCAFVRDCELHDSVAFDSIRRCADVWAESRMIITGHFERALCSLILKDKSNT